MNIMLVGVGGQGTLLASRILGTAFLSQGYDVKVSEVHGMAQRGGSVVTYVKYGKKVHSPVIEQGEADVLLAFERLEALRYVPYLKKNGQLIVNDRRIDPMPVITGAMEYPEDIIGRISALGIGLTAVDALSIAQMAGSDKAVNIVLLGLMSRYTNISSDIFLETIEKVVPEKFVELNKKAFMLGREYNG